MLPFRARALARAASSTLAACLLTVVLACSSSSSKSSPAAGGDGNDGPDGTGDAPGSGADGPGSGEPGDFGSIWRRVSAEVLTIEAGSGTGVPETSEIEFPAKVTDAQYETDVEVFEQLKDGELIVYAHYDDSQVYFRLRLPAQRLEDGYYRTSSDGSTSSYTLEDGALKLMQTQGSGTLAVITTTYYAKYEQDFPPADWPSEVVDVAAPQVVP